MEHSWQYGAARPPSEPVRQARAVALDLFRSPLPGYQTDDRWLQQSKYVGLPYVFISNLAKPIRAADVRVLERRPTKGRTTFGPNGTISKSTSANYGKSAREDYRPIDDDHPAARVIAEPQGDDGVDTIGDILEYGTIHGRLHGERPLWGVPSEKYLERGEYRPCQLYNLPPALLLPQPGRSMEYPMGWYRLMPYYPGGTAGWFGGRPVGATGVPLDAREVYRALYKHPSWKWAGYSPLTAAALMLDISESIDQARWSSMNRGIKPSVVVSVGGADESFLDALKIKMETKYGGSRNHDTAMVLGTPTTDGEVKVQNLFPSPKEFDYANSWDQAVAAVAAVFGVPRTVANLSTASAYAELYAARRQFHDSTVVPECREWSDFLTRVIGRPWSDGGRDICVEVIPQPVENEDAERETLQHELDAGAVTLNEYRQKRNMPPMPGGDVPLSVWLKQVDAKANPPEPVPAELAGGKPGVPAAKTDTPTGGGPPRPENPEGEGTKPPTGQRPTTKAIPQDRELADPAPYGFCPECRTPGVMAERRLNGNAHCANGHAYPRKKAKYASTQIQLTGAAAKKLRAFARAIPDADLGDDGREDDPHVTARYGLHATGPEPVASAVAGFGPVRYRLGRVAAFRGAETGKGYDVIFAEVESPDLHRLHAALGDVPHTDTWPTYKPHATVAYVKAGLADKYLAKFGAVDVDGETDALTFSTADRTHTTIPLSVAIGKAMSSLVDSAGGALIAPATVGVGRNLGRRKSKRLLRRLTGGK